MEDDIREVIISTELEDTVNVEQLLELEGTANVEQLLESVMPWYDSLSFRMKGHFIYCTVGTVMKINEFLW